MSKEIAALTGPLCLEKQGALLSLPSSEKETEFDLKRFTNSSVTSMTQCEWCIGRKESHLGEKKHLGKKNTILLYTYAYLKYPNCISL